MECKNCGYQTNDDKKFCPECGNQLTKSSNDPTIKKPLSKKVILIASIAAILSLSCIVFYFIGKGKFHPENKLQNFEQAIEDKNTDKLQKLLSPVNDSFDITKENTANFIKYLNSNPQKYDALLSRLTQQAESMSNSGENEMAYLNDTYATLNMIKKGKKWLLFDDYQIIVTPMYLDLYMDTKDVELYVDGNKVGTSTGKDYHEEFGPFMPGIHEIKATFKNPYAASSVSDEVELFDSSESKLVHTLELEAEEVTISSIYDDAALFVDGKKTDITVGPEEKSIGMFPTNESVSIYVEKEFPWGTAKSEEVYINSNHETFDTIYPLSKENQDEMLNQLNETLAQYAQALTKKDASVMKDGITDKLKKSLAERIKGIKIDEPDYTGKLLKTVYNKDTLLETEYDKQSKTYKFNIKAEVTYHEPNGDLGWLYRDKDKKNYTRTRMLTVVYDGKSDKWQLDKNELYYHVVTDNEEIVFNLE